MKSITIAILLSITIMASSQTTINYQTWNPSSLPCNLFGSATNVPATINGSSGSVAHQSTVGQPTYDGTNSAVNLDANMSGSNSIGSEYRISYNFQQGATYSIVINAVSIYNSSSIPYLRLKLVNSTGNSTSCNGPQSIDNAISGNLTYSQSVSSGNFNNYTFNNVGSTSTASSYLTIANVPNSSGGLQSILIRSITITQTSSPELVISPTSLSITCGTTTAQTFTVSNPNNVQNITSYEWNLGSSSNGWIYNGNAAPQNISTVANSITLTPVCGVALQNVSVTVKVNNANYKTYTSNVSITAPSYSINGGDLICSSDVYTVNNLPCNNTVTWTVTQTGSIVSSSINGNAITLSKVSNGVITLKADFSSCGTSKTISRTIQVGPQPATILYGSYCIEDPITLCANPVANATSRQWVARVNSSNVTLTESSDWCVDVPENTLYVDLFVTNDCGTTKTRQWIEYINCFTVNLSPNPADNMTTITLEQQNTKKQMDIKVVKLTNSVGVQMRQWAFGEGTKNAVLNLSTFPAGIYIVSATIDGKSWKSVQLKKQ